MVEVDIARARGVWPDEACQSGVRRPSARGKRKGDGVVCGERDGNEQRYLSIFGEDTSGSQRGWSTSERGKKNVGRVRSTISMIKRAK